MSGDLIYNDSVMEMTLEDLSNYQKRFCDLDNEAYNIIMKLQKTKGFDLVLKEINIDMNGLETTMVECRDNMNSIIIEMSNVRSIIHDFDNKIDDPKLLAALAGITNFKSFSRKKSGKKKKPNFIHPCLYGPPLPGGKGIFHPCLYGPPRPKKRDEFHPIVYGPPRPKKRDEFHPIVYGPPQDPKSEPTTDPIKPVDITQPEESPTTPTETPTTPTETPTPPADTTPVVTPEPSVPAVEQAPNIEQPAVEEINSTPPEVTTTPEATTIETPETTTVEPTQPINETSTETVPTPTVIEPEPTSSTVIKTHGTAKSNTNKTALLYGTAATAATGAVGFGILSHKKKSENEDNSVEINDNESSSDNEIESENKETHKYINISDNENE